VLSGWLQALLDITFVQENLLVESGFPISQEEEYLALLSRLDSVEEIFASCISRISSIDGNPLTKETCFSILASIEQREALYWRRGALRYMYIATLIQENRMSESEKEKILVAVTQLEEMHNVRTKTPKEFDLIDGNKEVLALVKEGVLGTTHLLGLMYRGELYYWFNKHCEKGEEKESPSSKSQAIQLLTKYVSIIDNVEGLGWDNTRAKQLLTELE